MELKSFSLSYADCAVRTGGKTGEIRGMKPRLLDTRDTAAGTGLGESQGELTSDGLFWENPSTKILRGVILQDKLKQSQPTTEVRDAIMLKNLCPGQVRRHCIFQFS